ncbi:hypothetical protein CN941_21350 [Bacillus cereus]|nr:hypothetical protein CN527_21495 [Bacillus cereus]PFA26011.1 hypothetical protein CN390_28510 [Bacillus cereus]PGL33869.1 hypothetical protein CN930_20325 [Bacillus cereus]PGM38180.1 hypothetical protein CN941_21350 [Bacillus cereus]PGN89228.1 hypothetical protein CN976_27080 [Bacillus cereus]
MAKLSKTKLERIAVDAVESHANKPDALLRANIPVGDKGISFDGDIEVFRDASESVGSLIGKVPVQVKGTEVQEFTNGIRTFPMGLNHFQNYYNSQGVVLFVVEIKNNGESLIFYKQLLPTEIRQVLKKYGEEKGQKQRRIELRPLSETNLTSVCTKFLAESKKQATILIEHNPFEREDYHEFELTSLTYNPTEIPTGNIFEHDFTLYGRKGELSVPLEQGRVQSVTFEVQETVIIDEHSYNVNIEVTEEQHKVLLLIENSLEITYGKNANSFNFKILKLHSLSTQLKVLPMILDMLSGNHITFQDLKETFECGNTKKQEQIYINIIELHATFLKLREVFGYLEIDESTTFGDEEQDINKFIHQINSFNKMILENDFSNHKIASPEETKFILFNLGEMKLFLFYNPQLKPRLTSAFSNDVLIGETRVIMNNVISMYTPYVLLNTSGLAYASNVNIDVIKNSFNRIEPYINSDVANYTNEFCLMCMNAFDLVPNIELLDLADHIYNMYAGENFTADIVTINQLQIKKRREKSLSQSDIQELFSIKVKNRDNLEMQFCTSVLLESSQEAKLFFEQLETGTQERYTEFPIYKLYNQLCATKIIV